MLQLLKGVTQKVLVWYAGTLHQGHRVKVKVIRAKNYRYCISAGVMQGRVFAAV